MMSSSVSFLDALLSRYADPKYSECDVSCELFIIGSLSPGKSGNNLILPPGLSLNGCGISSCGSQQKIREVCVNVEELDLADNNLTDLRDVHDIISCLPSLKFLNLSQNDFSKAVAPSSQQAPGCPGPRGGGKYESIRSLVLNNTRVPWIAISHLLESMPNLSELHLSLNNYTSMEMDSKARCYPNINRLYISGNPSLCSFDEVSNLVSSFPSLEGLTMADCNISRIPESFESLLPHLQSLNITNWPIDDWDSLERLNNLPNLIELRCQGVKVLESMEASTTSSSSLEDNKELVGRYHLISRLPRIQRLNGSEIEGDERMFAERAFVRWHLNQPGQQDRPKPKRFDELHQLYGRVDPLAQVDLSPPKSAQVTVVYNENSNDDTLLDPDFLMTMSTGSTGSNGDNSNNSSNSNSSGSPSSLPPATRVRDMTVNLNKSVKDFKERLSTIFGLPASRMRLFYVDHVMMEIMGPEEMKFNQKKLYSYNVQDGDKFLVDAK